MFNTASLDKTGGGKCQVIRLAPLVWCLCNVWCVDVRWKLYLMADGTRSERWRGPFKLADTPSLLLVRSQQLSWLSPSLLVCCRNKTMLLNSVGQCWPRHCCCLLTWFPALNCSSAY